MQQIISNFYQILSTPLFYDIPEYLQIVGNHSFWEVFSMGHFPIHPVFLGILWILTRVLPVNAIAILFGAISIFIFYRISKIIFKKGSLIIPTIVFALFPAVWLINTNLMVESVALTFYLAAVYFLLTKRKVLFFISLFLMIGIHLQSIVWIFSIFIFPYILSIKFKRKEVFAFIRIAVISIVVSAIFYAALYYFSGRTIGGTTEQLSTYFSSGVLRMIRNSWLSFIRNFGTFIPFILLFVFVKNVKSKVERTSWFLFFGLVGVIGANWQGDFMGRRIIFAGVLIALLIYKYLGKKTIFVILYLLPIVIANVLLYSKGNPFTLPILPSGQVLVETHYLKPFTKYDGIILWIGDEDLGKIDGYLKNGKRVFLTKQAVTAPYRLLVGNNYHITSLGKVGESESRFLFQKYVVEPYVDVYEIKLFKGGVVSSSAGEPVIFYGNGFRSILARRRIDYGDIGSWIWMIVTNKKDSAGWTYKDSRDI
jgi:hypothetical protein